MIDNIEDDGLVDQLMVQLWQKKPSTGMFLISVLRRIISVREVAFISLTISAGYAN